METHGPKESSNVGSDRNGRPREATSECYDLIKRLDLIKEEPETEFNEDEPNPDLKSEVAIAQPESSFVPVSGFGISGEENGAEDGTISIVSSNSVAVSPLVDEGLESKMSSGDDGTYIIHTTFL